MRESRRFVGQAVPADISCCHSITAIRQAETSRSGYADRIPGPKSWGVTRQAQPALRDLIALSNFFCEFS